MHFDPSRCWPAIGCLGAQVCLPHRLPHHISKNYIFAPNAKIFAFMPSMCHVAEYLLAFQANDILLMTSCDYLMLTSPYFQKLHFCPKRQNLYNFTPTCVDRPLASLEPKFCLPHHDDIILMTSCAYLMLTSSYFQKLYFAPKDKIFAF